MTTRMGRWCCPSVRAAERGGSRSPKWLYVQGQGGVFRVRKVLLTFALALLLAVAATGVALAADTFEPNDTVSDAYRIYSGPKTSYIWSSTDVDYFRVFIWGGCEFKATLTVPASKDFDLDLLDASGNLLATSRNGAGVAEQLTYTPGADMWVYLKVYGYQGAYDQSNPYVVWAGWTDPGEVAVKFSTSYRTFSLGKRNAPRGSPSERHVSGPDLERHALRVRKQGSGEPCGNQILHQQRVRYLQVL